MKRIAILGSTGSIGTQTLDVVRANGDIEVVGIAAGRNIDALESQIREFSPKICGVWDEEKAKELAVRVADCWLTLTLILPPMDITYYFNLKHEKIPTHLGPKICVSFSFGQ